VLDDRLAGVLWPLPDLVVAAARDERVDRRRPALGGASAQYQRPVNQYAVQPEAVDVGRLPFVEDPAIREVVEAAAQLGGSLGVCPPEEVPCSVGLVVRHQGRALARDLVPDRLELVKLGARSEPDLVVLQAVRPEHPQSDRTGREASLDQAPVCEAGSAPGHRGGKERG
jgi:hypothetical protein